MATIISPVYPGTVLQNGSSGSTVARMQSYLNALRAAKYPSLSLLTVDGKYGSATTKTVMQYQAIQGLTMDGHIGQNTWNAIVLDYNNTIGGSADTYPGIALRPGFTGQDVTHMQVYLNDLAGTYMAINRQTVDGEYGSNMSAAVRRFQRQFGLTNDGIIGKNTWNRIVAVHAALSGTKTHVTTPYGGTVLTVGSTGDNVRYLQSYLEAIPGTGSVTVDGSFGKGTQAAVIRFQAMHGLTADGKVGSSTWAALIPAFNATL